MSEEIVASPCVSICVLDADDICEGCYRSAAEITEWSQMSNPEKRQVIGKCGERFKSANKHLLL